MIEVISNGLISAGITIANKTLSKEVFEKVIRRTLSIVIKKIVESTENTVDDDLVKPILDELNKY